jgi:hypothetical protein
VPVGEGIGMGRKNLENTEDEFAVFYWGYSKGAES